MQEAPQATLVRRGLLFTTQTPEEAIIRKYFAGLDVHWSHTNACILDARGKKVKRFTVRGPWMMVPDELAKLQGKLFVCYESSCGYGHIYDLVRRLAQLVVVAHPGQLRLIFRSKRKNDRVASAPSTSAPGVPFCEVRESFSRAGSASGCKTACDEFVR
jgi:hypothetical protein